MPSRRHHYIPQFYLRQWIGPDGKLCEFQIPHDHLIDKRRYPSETGYQDDLYSLGPEAGPNAQWIEDIFLLIADQGANDALQIILNGAAAGKWKFTNKERSGWSRFLMTLFSRTPDRVATLRKLQTTALAKIAADLDAAYDAAHANDSVTPTPEEKALSIRTQQELSFGMVLQRVMDLPDVGDKFNNMIWQVIGVEKGRRNLLTSDRPVLLSNGLQHLDSFLMLPISPTQLFVAANDLKSVQNLLKMKVDDVVEQSNTVVTRQAAKFVYATDTKQMRFVENHFKKR